MAEEEDGETLGVGPSVQLSEETKEKMVPGDFTSDTSPELRENLIHTALLFLQNTKVRESPIAQKRAFLRRKGLTEEEIVDVFRRSGIPEEDAANFPPQHLVHYHQHPSLGQVSPVTAWRRIRETVVAGILLWGLSKGVHKIYKEYVSPYFGIKSSSERRMEIIENSVLEMQNNMVETMKKVQNVVDTIQQQQQQMFLLTEEILKTKTKSNAVTYPQTNRLSNEIKSELTSIKGILLSRKQFPTVPNTSASLPAWQLSERSTSSNDNNPVEVPGEVTKPPSMTPELDAAANSSEQDQNSTALISIDQSPVSSLGDQSVISSLGDQSDISPVNSEDLTSDTEDSKDIFSDNMLSTGTSTDTAAAAAAAAPAQVEVVDTKVNQSKKSKKKKESPKVDSSLKSINDVPSDKTDKSHVV